MNPTIIASIISASSALIGVILTNQYQLRRQTNELKAHLDEKAKPAEAKSP